MAVTVRVGTELVDTITAAPGDLLIASGLGGDDTLTGAELADNLFGNDGNDTLAGNAGDDILDGGAGDDNLNTGAGNDLVFGGDGIDTIGGMAGRDIVIAGAGDDDVRWNDPDGDRVAGGEDNDILRGGDVADDTISGGAGNDLIRAVANQELETHAPDVLFGDEGNDVIIGGNADDLIEGGAGDDMIASFGGADTLVFRADTPGSDVVLDFDTSQDIAMLVGFGTGFDPLANLSQEAAGTALDLGAGGEVLFVGRLVGEFAAEDFNVV
jgi:serralysin